MRFAVAGVACILTMVSCREVVPLQAPAPTINGYQLNGTVTTTNGTPVDGAQVLLYYTSDLTSQTPLDTQRVVVQGIQQQVSITVLTARYVYVRTIFQGPLPPGEVHRPQWDERDDGGNLVPSGEYLIRYTVDTTVVKDSPVIVSGNPTAVTNAAGAFTIGNDRLPIGVMFDWYDSDGTFGGVYTVLPTVSLVFQKSGHQVVYESVSLQQNQVTTGAFTF